MTPRQLFRVVSASLGLWYMLRGSMVLLDAFMMAMHLNEPAAHTTMHSYAVAGGFQMFIGFFVMCGVPAFDRMAFPRHHKEIESRDAEKSPTAK